MDDAQEVPPPAEDRTSQQTADVLPRSIIESVGLFMEKSRRQMLDETLAAPRSGEEHIRARPMLQQLPFDVIEVIARCLATEAFEERDMDARATLARFNRVSKAVHQVTLAALYETTDYFEKEDFTKSVKLENPKGWIWTKYLSLGPISEPLLCQQQRYSRNLYDVPDEDIDFAPSFPRLRLACFLGVAKDVAAHTSGYRVDVVNVAVYLFKPMGFAGLQYRCRPCADEAWDIFGLFGINPRFSSSLTQMHHRKIMGNVIELIVAEGAGMLPPSNYLTQGRPWNVASRGTVEEPTASFHLVLLDPTPTPLTASTIELVLEFLEFGRTSARDRWGHEPHLLLKCYPSVSASFVSLLDPAKLLPDLSILLLGTVDSENEIVQLMSTLAESISPYYPCFGSRVFVNVRCVMAVPPGISLCSDRQKDCEFHIMGTLQEGQPENAAGPLERSGFTLRVESSLKFANGTSEKTDFRYQRAYPGVQLLQ